MQNKRIPCGGKLRNLRRGLFLYAYTIKPPAKLVVPLTALALDKKTSNDIISVGPKPHYI
mgnify:CR=1 FL=1